MKQSEAWVLQAKSDFAAAQAVFNDVDEPTYCQAIAKYQQVTEKSIKGMIAALNEQGTINIHISTTQHKVYREMNELNSSRRDRLRSDDKKWVEQIDGTLKRLEAEI
jgi:HEPN domain-containing protein